ncbi:MAG: hypothetical protein M1282_01285 [Chloroflexi bacterium]|nr:hypothetical protein [Chloroflexota bacterium]
MRGSFCGTVTTAISPALSVAGELGQTLSCAIVDFDVNTVITHKIEIAGMKKNLFFMTSPSKKYFHSSAFNISFARSIMDSDDKYVAQSTARRHLALKSRSLVEQPAQSLRFDQQATHPCAPLRKERGMTR